MDCPGIAASLGQWNALKAIESIAVGAYEMDAAG
jgi:hypothetical protein